MKRLLLVGWEAADWKLIKPLVDTGAMPMLKQVLQSGASGDLLSGAPLISAIQWTTIATGKRAWQHRVGHAVERVPGTERVQPIGATSRQARAVWEILGAAQKQCIVAGWPATHGSSCKNVRLVSDRFPEPTAPPGVRPWPAAVPGTYNPREISPHLDPLRTSPEEIQADLVSQFIPDWRKVDQRQDRRIAQLRLFLSADFSQQTAIIKLLREGIWDFASVRLAALGGLSQVFLPFHPPENGDGHGEASSLYRGVMDAAYKLLDRMLHDLLRAAGPDTALMLVSANGVHPERARLNLGPSSDPLAWKSPYGIFAACGRGFSRGSQTVGARGLDVCPSILAWYGLPLADDMEGRVLLECFANAPPTIDHIATWEDSALKNEQRPPLSNPSAQTDQLGRETDWNLAQTYLEAGRNAEALPLFERVFRSFPERFEHGHALFQCQLAAGQLPTAQATLELLLELLPENILAYLLRAEFSLAARDVAAARRWTDKARHAKTTHPELMRRLGLLLLKLREWDALAALATAALQVNASEPLAWLGLAEAHLRQGKPAEAEKAALQAIGLNYFLPDAHFVLARALVAGGKWQAAKEAMAILKQIQPANRSASAYARRLDERRGDQP